MAGLNCEIGWKTRLCEVNGELGQFHIWEQWSNVVDASPLRGGHPGGQMRKRFERLMSKAKSHTMTIARNSAYRLFATKEDTDGL